MSSKPQVKSMFHGDLSVFPASAKTLPGGNPRLWYVLYRISVSVKNTGHVTGSAVPQLYLVLPRGSVEGFVAKSLLRGFEKVQLRPGESRTVEFNLTRRDISHWDSVEQQWAIARGAIQANIGFSSRDFHAVTSFSPLG